MMRMWWTTRMSSWVLMWTTWWWWSLIAMFLEMGWHMSSSTSRAMWTCWWTILFTSSPSYLKVFILSTPPVLLSLTFMIIIVIFVTKKSDNIAMYSKVLFLSQQMISSLLTYCQRFPSEILTGISTKVALLTTYT